MDTQIATLFLLCLASVEFSSAKVLPHGAIVTRILPGTVEKGYIWERGDKFEGDILLPEGTDVARNGVPAGNRWPKGIVPYTIVKSHFTQQEVSVIEKGLQGIERVSCVKFVPRKNSDQYYVQIRRKDEDCYADLGRVGPAQVLNLGKQCVQHHVVIHEALHSLGFHHQQSAHDRDSYIRINKQNIRPDLQHNFMKMTVGTNFGVEYDYKSVMHYSQYAGSINNQPTMTALKPFSGDFGNDQGPTQSDILKLNRMYGCKSK